MLDSPNEAWIEASSHLSDSGASRSARAAGEPPIRVAREDQPRRTRAAAGDSLAAGCGIRSGFRPRVDACVSPVSDRTHACGGISIRTTRRTLRSLARHFYVSAVVEGVLRRAQNDGGRVQASTVR